MSPRSSQRMVNGCFFSSRQIRTRRGLGTFAPSYKIRSFISSAPLLCSGQLKFGRHIVTRQQAINRPVKFFPRRLPEAVIFYDERGACIEFFILLMPAGEF